MSAAYIDHVDTGVLSCRDYLNATAYCIGTTQTSHDYTFSVYQGSSNPGLRGLYFDSANCRVYVAEAARDSIGVISASSCPFAGPRGPRQAVTLTVEECSLDSTDPDPCVEVPQ